MLSDKIRGARIIQGMSQSQLARRSGHAVSTIHGIENGDNKNPSFKTICDIAKVLEIPLNELYQETLSKKAVNANQRP
ncbi:XRE family transcriptional regulator [Ruminococcaceae bacterium BL-6]|nr:XRE family transcriptional regulator [Ruminococcaceae bacterium BL-6]